MFVIDSNSIPLEQSSADNCEPQHHQLSDVRPQGSAISADYSQEIVSEVPPCRWHKGNVLWESSDDDKYFEALVQPGIFWYRYVSL